MMRCGKIMTALGVAALVICPAIAGEPSTSATEETDEGPVVITVSKAGDALGAPVALQPKLAAEPFVAATAARVDGRPLAKMALTSRFGMRGHPTLGGARMHSGIDLAAPSGSPVYATASGTISFANWKGGYGLLVVVEHGAQLQTRFGHLSRVMVAPGQGVVKGQVLGLVGSTGRSTGPHLHYEVRRGGTAVNPLAHR